MFSLESPHSNEYTQYTIFNINEKKKKKKKKTLNDLKSAFKGFFSKGVLNESETAVINESSVIEPLKIY